ncbi:MAG: hypothetical protein WD492_10590 [Alkalispirochaeta sp.]
MGRNLPAASALLVVAVVISAISTSPIPAQDAPSSAVRVHVLPVVNRSGQAQFDAVATTVTDTVSLTLRLLGNYDISHGEPVGRMADRDAERPTRQGSAVPAPLPSDSTALTSALATRAEDLQVENIVFGEILPPEDTELPRIRLGVFDRLSGEITVQEERTPQNLFGIFTITDELAADVLSGFAGRRVAFGTIRITPEYGGNGEAPSYRVALDGEELGANLRSVDSILTGTHQLTITTEVMGEKRVLLDEEISVEEGAPREVALELPDIDMVAEDQARARREAEERQRAAIRRLQAERRIYNSSLAQQLYLTADEFLDPELIRREALENARVQAEFRLRRGQTMLSDGRWNEGIATHEAIGELALTFNQEDLFGYEEEIGFATASYGELIVQQQRNPNALLPWLFFGAAFVVTIPAGESYFAEPGPPMAQFVPFFPVVFAGVSTAIWNATDWDYRPMRRLLRRYGEEGLDAVDRLRPWPEWEVALGVTATEGYNGFRITPGPSGAEYGVGTVLFAQASYTPALRLRYWMTPRNALGGELRVGSVGGRQDMAILSDSYGYTIETNPDSGSYSELDVSEVFMTAFDWSHTRTGRTIIDAGFTLRLLEFSTDNIRYHDGSILQEETYEELLGGSTAFVAIPGVRTGFELRFGRGELPPWGLSLHYRLERAVFPNGILADEGPYYLNRFDASLRRSVYIGMTQDGGGDDGGGAANTGAARTEAGPTETDTRTAEEGRARAEARWTPRPIQIYADPGGFLTRGPRMGLEYQLAPQWSVGVHGRWTASLAMAEILPVDATLHQPEFAWPGVSLRWYQQPQDRPPQEVASGWYAGGIVEYGWFDLPRYVYGEAGSSEDGSWYESFTNEGSLWFVLAEGGYRLPMGRSGFLDLGVQAGVRLGEGYRTVRYTEYEDGFTETETEASMGAGTWMYPTLSVGTRLY